MKVPAITARINPDICTACGLCAKVCPYHAIEGSKEQGFYQVIEAACPGVRGLRAGMPVRGIDQTHFTEEQIVGQIDKALAKEPTTR